MVDAVQPLIEAGLKADQEVPPKWSTKKPTPRSA